MHCTKSTHIEQLLVNLAQTTPTSHHAAQVLPGDPASEPQLLLECEEELRHKEERGDELTREGQVEGRERREGWDGGQLTGCRGIILQEMRLMAGGVASNGREVEVKHKDREREKWKITDKFIKSD